MTASVCPGCGAPNACALACDGEAPDCWCMHVVVDAARIEAAGEPTQCLCRQCAAPQARIAPAPQPA